MIPIIGVPILNRGDLLLRLARSIDYAVGKLVVINNGDDPGVRAAIEQLQSEGDFDLLVHQPGFNLGVAASWNWIMRAVSADYWLIVGNDIQFTPGDLRKIDRFVRAHPDYVLCPANWGHSLFAIRPTCVEQVGWFDESPWPAYCEDQDQMYRMKLADERYGTNHHWADVPDVHAVHGEPPLWGSSTVWSDPVLNKRCAVTQKNNHEWYKRKWGGYPGEEVFVHPYDDPALTWKDCPIDYDLWKANGHPMFVEGGLS